MLLLLLNLEVIVFIHEAFVIHFGYILSYCDFIDDMLITVNLKFFLTYRFCLRPLPTMNYIFTNCI